MVLGISYYLLRSGYKESINTSLKTCHDFFKELRMQLLVFKFFFLLFIFNLSLSVKAPPIPYLYRELTGFMIFGGEFHITVSLADVMNGLGKPRVP